MFTVVSSQGMDRSQNCKSIRAHLKLT